MLLNNFIPNKEVYYFFFFCSFNSRRPDQHESGRDGERKAISPSPCDLKKLTSWLGETEEDRKIADLKGYTKNKKNLFIYKSDITIV